MIYYAVADISQLTTDKLDILRDKIEKHFVKSETLKRKDSVAAKALLCELFERQFGLTDFTVDCDKNGKPFIIDCDICFNLSHSGNMVLCALGDEKVGCDVQEIKQYNPKVAKRFFSRNEYELLGKSNNKAFDFTKMWVLKESALKFSGEGVSGGLDRYDFSEYYNKDSFSSAGLCFNILEITGYVISICSEKGSVLKLNAEI